MYNLSGSILGLLPLYGSGAMWLEIYDLQLSAQAAVLINADGFAEVTEFQISADFSDINIHLENLLGSGKSKVSPIRCFPRWRKLW